MFRYGDGPGERAPDGRWWTAVWSRPRSNIAGWSPRYGDCRPDIGWVGSVSGRVAWSSADGRLQAGDGNTDGCITTGFQRWNTEGDVQDQYETFNGMPVCYALATLRTIIFDVPDGMDLMVHRHSRIPASLDVQQESQMDVAPVCQTVSYATRDEWDMSDNDSLTAIADEDDPNMDDFYQRVVSSDDENYFDSDDGSVTDFDGSMSEGVYCVVSGDGSVADLYADMLEMKGQADQWPGGNSIYRGYIHPVLWTGYMLSRRRSKCLNVSL